MTLSAARWGRQRRALARVLTRAVRVPLKVRFRPRRLSNNSYMALKVRL